MSQKKQLTSIENIQGIRKYTELEICCRIIRAAMIIGENELGGATTEEIQTYLKPYGNFSKEDVHFYCRKLCENFLFGEITISGKTVGWTFPVSAE